MANTIVNTSLVAKETAYEFMNNLKGIASFNRQYSDEFARSGAKIGDSLRIRIPQRFEVTDGDAFQPQDLLDQTVTLSLSAKKGVHMGWTSSEETLELDMIRERYIAPAAARLANAANTLAMASVYPSVFNCVGTVGTTPSSALTFLQAGVKLDDQAVEEDDRCAVLDTLAAATLANGVSTLFNPQGKISETWRKGQFGADQLNIQSWYKDQNIPRHTTGSSANASTPLVKGAGQTGSSLLTDGWGAATAFKIGDIITIAGVYSVNPQNYQSTGRLQQFVITADLTNSAGAAEENTLSISPSIVTSGPLQTVSGSPANDAVITYWNMSAGGTFTSTVSPQSLVFHKDAFTVAFADLVMPNGGAKGSRVSSKQFNLALRLVEQFDIKTDKNLSRVDFIMGAVAVRAAAACRVVG